MIDEHYTEADTRKVASALLSIIAPQKGRATVVGLSGDLGAGKTTLTQSIGTLLGVEASMQSPTFVIAKRYETKHPDFSSLVHMDAYRIESETELAPLRFDELLREERTLVVIEWPERIEAALPESAILFTIEHKGDRRRIFHA